MVVVAAAAVEEEWVWLPGLSQPRPLVLRPPPPLLVLAPGHFQAVVLLVHHLPEHLPREREREKAISILKLVMSVTLQSCLPYSAILTTYEAITLCAHTRFLHSHNRDTHTHSHNVWSSISTTQHKATLLTSFRLLAVRLTISKGSQQS